MIAFSFQESEVEALIRPITFKKHSVLLDRTEELVDVESLGCDCRDIEDLLLHDRGLQVRDTSQPVRFTPWPVLFWFGMITHMVVICGSGNIP